MRTFAFFYLVFWTAVGTVEAIPNPAAVYCTELGYEYQIRTHADSGQYGVCVFPDGSECEEWAFYRKCYLGDTSAACGRKCEELPCRRAGESVLVGECCKGLGRIRPTNTFGPDCNDLQFIGWVFLCSDCGNGICESWENKCNCPADCKGPKVLYVDSRATGSNNGSSWANAYKFLQDAITDADSSPKPVEIRVAQGIYKPYYGTDITIWERKISFQIKNGVALRGGYIGADEPDPNARDIIRYDTILSGDLLGDDEGNANDTDNSFHVIVADNTDDTAILDGFTITAGSASGWTYSQLSGGGMYIVNSNFLIVHCILRGNFADYGSALWNYKSNPNFIECAFTENFADYSGGAVQNVESCPRFINCLFIQNTVGSSGIGGGAIYNEKQSNAKFKHCRFVSNLGLYGGAMTNDQSSPVIEDCIFAGNWTYRPSYSSIDVSSVQVSASDEQVSLGTATREVRFGREWFGGSAGAMYNTNASSPMITFSTFTRNVAGSMCGGIYNGNDCDPTLANCILCGNSAGYIPEQSAQIRGGEPVLSYNCIQGFGPNPDRDGNFYADPQFAKPGYWADPNALNIPIEPKMNPNAIWIDGDYHLKSQAGRWDPNTQTWVKDDVTSPCIDAGDPMSPIGLEPFPNGGRINMGAYGGTAEASKSYFDKPVCEAILAGDINGDCVVDFEDLELIASHWLGGN